MSYVLFLDTLLRSFLYSFHPKAASIFPATAEAQCWAHAERREGERVAVPNPDKAVIDPAKLRDYLLSPAHPIGRFKAIFFVSLGYNRDGVSVLDRDLRAHVASAVVTRVERTPYGQKYVVRGRIRGPAGREAGLISVWVVLTGEDYPRFVTAYPGGA